MLARLWRKKASPKVPVAGVVTAVTDQRDIETLFVNVFINISALHKAGRHMEDCILAAYIALLIGCTIQGNSVSDV